MIRQYGDHPSIVVWCMHNESPHAMEWMKQRTPDQNLALDDALAALARARSTRRASCTATRGPATGTHYYGWYEGKLEDVATADLEPLVTEYGAASLPGRRDAAHDVRRRDHSGRTRRATGRAWQFADFQPKRRFDVAKVSAGPRHRRVRRATRSATRPSPSATRPRSCAAASGRKNTGVYQFMFVDDWPSITWSVVDYYRRPKLAYAALAQAMQRVLPSLEYDPRDPASRSRFTS